MSDIGKEIAQRKLDKMAKQAFIENNMGYFNSDQNQSLNARKEYYRQYYANNKEKYKEYAEKYWQKKSNTKFFSINSEEE